MVQVAGGTNRVVLESTNLLGQILFIKLTFGKNLITRYFTRYHFGGPNTR
jgi:hypothetical protein